MVSLPILAAMMCYHQWNLFGISWLEITCLKKITILLIELKTVCEHLPSTLSIWIKELREDTIILKPDKSNGVVVIDTTDYYESLNKLFSDTTKFKRLVADSTNTRFSTLQSYFRNSYNRNKISEEVYKENRLKHKNS